MNIYVMFIVVEDGYTFGEWTAPENISDTLRRNLKPGVDLKEIIRKEGEEWKRIAF